MGTVVKRALQGFNLGWAAHSKVGGMVARRKGYTAGWTARGVADQKLALRRERAQALWAGTKNVLGWTAVLGLIGAVVITATMGDEIGQMIGEKSA